MPMLLAVLATALVLFVGLYPCDFQSRGGEQWLALADWDVLGLLGAAALFVPLGFFESGLACAVLMRTFAPQSADAESGQEFDPRGSDPQIRGRAWGNLVMLLVVMDAALLGLIVETLQLWLPGQQSSVLDLVANVLGGTLGGMVAGQFRSMRSGFAGE